MYDYTVVDDKTNSRFSLDALQATQIAERLGLAGTGAAELEQQLTLGGDLQGPGGPDDRPQALPLGRTIRTTPRRRHESSVLLICILLKFQKNCLKLPIYSTATM